MVEFTIKCFVTEYGACRQAQPAHTYLQVREDMEDLGSSENDTAFPTCQPERKGKSKLNSQHFSTRSRELRDLTSSK